MSRIRWRDLERKEDARLLLCLRYCCTCGSIVEIRKGVMDKHYTNRGIGVLKPLCPGKRWRR